jgi:Fic family protein
VAEDLQMDRRLAARLAEKKALLDRHRPLSEHTLRRLYEDLRVVLTYHSNAIEGNTLTLRETQIVIDYGMTVDGHSLREILEATHHASAFDTIVSLANRNEPISVTIILELHHLIMHDILDHDQVGTFRRGPVFIRGARLTPPHAREVPELMEQWVAWVNGEEGQRNEPIVRATIAHHGFEGVHPFIDGNGRLGRLLLNLLLMQAGYPPALLLREWRGRYIMALSQADTGNYRALINLIGLAVEEGLDRYLQAIEQGEIELVPLAELAGTFDLKVDYLGWLARHGRLDAVKQGGRWYSTPQAIQRYQQEAQEGKRQPKRGARLKG